MNRSKQHSSIMTASCQHCAIIVTGPKAALWAADGPDIIGSRPF